MKTYNASEISYKEEQYRDYIDEHIKNVQLAWEEFQKKCSHLIENQTQYAMIRENIQVHDQSKYGKEEFDAYRRNFYPVCDQEKEEAQSDFNRAWEHHYKNNLHHWNAWKDHPNDMPFVYVVEMVCDWQAMGYKFGNNAKEWYDKNKNHIILGTKQKKWVETMVDFLAK